MSKYNDGGAAFPRRVAQVDNPERFDEEELAPQQGLSMVDWFAGQALMGAFAGAGSEGYPFSADYGDGSEDPSVTVARHCYLLADAMIAEKRRREAGK